MMRRLTAIQSARRSGKGALLRGFVREDNAFYRNHRVLGKAVHESALERLHELWPEAMVFVQHHGRSSTRVIIRKHPDSTVVREARARCAAGDQFNRRYGVQLAFRRALRAVAAHEQQAAWRDGS